MGEGRAWFTPLPDGMRVSQIAAVSCTRNCTAAAKSPSAAVGAVAGLHDAHTIVLAPNRLRRSWLPAPPRECQEEIHELQETAAMLNVWLYKLNLSLQLPRSTNQERVCQG
jgi:hypothetical protein